MEFRLDAEQVELQRSVGRFFDDRFPLDGLGQREGVPVDRTAWAAMADMGIVDVLDLGALEATLVFEQVGSHLVAGPLLWTALAATVVDVDGRIVGGVEATAVDDGVGLVEHADVVDLVLVLHDDHVTTHEPGTTEPLAPLDPLTPVGRMRLGSGTEVAGDARELRRLGTLLAAAALVGVADRALQLARDHALEREQFGVPIGSFQAVKHLLADRHVANGLAQSATYAAAAEPSERAVSVAKLLAAEAALDGAATAIQVLGGMGFTWELPTNHLLKRAWVLALTFGTADEHALVLGDALTTAH
jgi:alkylation response protein AidB-like acyl-CoA dehydrogenase